MNEDIRGVVQGILLAVAALMPIVNPLGTAPLFLSLTQDLTDAERAVLARQVAINGFVLLVVAVFAGDYVLDFFGVSVPVLQVAGGFVVASLGFRLLHDSGIEIDSRSVESESALGAKAFYPLTLPLTTGPGAIAVVISLGLSRGSYSSSTDEVVLVLSTVCADLVIAAASFVCFAYADRVQRLLGAGGTDVAVRLSAFILFCLGIQILWAGGSELLHSVVHSAAPPDPTP